MSFPEGRNDGIRFMAHCWEDLRVLPKPLALHLASEAGALACHGALRALGFRHQSCQVRAHACMAGRLTPASLSHTLHVIRLAGCLSTQARVSL